MIEKSIGRNYLYNLLLTLLNLLFPLVTVSYISVILGAENIGKVNYAMSISNWFIVLASYGIPRYGVRAIARARESKIKLSINYFNLLFIQFVLSILASVGYLIVIFTFESFRSDISLYLVMVLTIILNTISLDWFYQGIEEYGYITIRSIIFKIISILLLFLLVKERTDYIYYAIINIIGLSLNNVLNFIYSFKFVDFKFAKINFPYYFKELNIYFLTTLIISLYSSFDQIVIGYFSTSDLAYYVRSKVFLGIGSCITSAIITVLIPRTSFLITTNREKYMTITRETIKYIYILGFPCVFGIASLARELMIVFGGEEFLPAVISLQMLSILILITAIGSWQINQILIPHHKESLALKIQMLIAVFSLLLNMLLIPKYSYLGASITLVFSEFFLMVIVSFVIKATIKDLKITYFSESMVKCLISSFIMMINILLIKTIFNNYFFVIFTSIIFSPLIYFGLLFLLKESTILGKLKKFKMKNYN